MVVVPADLLVVLVGGIGRVVNNAPCLWVGTAHVYHVNVTRAQGARNK
jgi:hypothetical protein